MSDTLKVSIGQHSDKGCKEVNQDFHGACMPQGLALAAKGVVVALADGISSSDVSQIASAAAVHGLLQDYYCTSEAWSVKRSAQCVLAATNSWLHAQTQRSPYRFDKDRGYVCTLSALIVKSATAHLFHVGDTRIYRVQGKALEQLTEDHRVRLSAEQIYLGRALGVQPQLEVDYRALPVEPADTFVLTTDGVHEHVSASFITQAIEAHATDLDQAARAIVDEALRCGSDDNLTIQIVRIDALPQQDASELQRQRATLQLPPVLEPRAMLDGYQIVRELHGSHRSHVYLAIDTDSGQKTVLKTPSIDLQDNAAGLDRFLMEEWIARRIHSPHVLQPAPAGRKREYLYVAMEYVQGQTLAQWMIDHPRPELSVVRDIVDQIARGLQAFHRMEMLHQDLRPENIMIDRSGTAKIIDFGATHVAGLTEGLTDSRQPPAIQGTLQYTAPEYFTGQGSSARSDLFSLAVLVYQMLTGQLPYGLQVTRLRSPADTRKLRYVPVRHLRPDLPDWLDVVLQKALHPDPAKRQEAVSEFMHDLHFPSHGLQHRRAVPLIERNPVVFWQTTTAVLALAVLWLTARLVLAA